MLIVSIREMNGMKNFGKLIFLSMVFLPLFLTEQELDCCAKATFDLCTKACYKIRRSRRFIKKLPHIRSVCPSNEEEFWHCIKDSLKLSEVLNPHNECCAVAKSSACAVECLLSRGVGHLQTECDIKDEVNLRHCLNKRFIEKRCCGRSKTAQCQERCEQYLSSRSTQHNSSMLSIFHQFCESSPDTLKCLHGYMAAEPEDQYSSCCKYGKTIHCQQECHRLFARKTEEKDLVSQLNLICGPTQPKDALYRCILGTLSSSGAYGEGHEKIFHKGPNLLRGHCCPVARSETCKTWCTHALSRKPFINFDDPLYVQCMENPNEYELSTCIGDVLEPCKYGCMDHLKFCSNFNHRPLELFRRCDAHADRTAEELYRSWKTGDFSALPVKFSVQNIQSCEPQLWKALACTLAIKPCSRKSNRNQVCRSDCVSLLKKCLVEPSGSAEKNAEKICMILMPNPDQTDCISASSFIVPVDSSLEQFATFPCQNDPCKPSQVCSINEDCSFGRQSKNCRPYLCLPGCSLGVSATIKVRNLDLFKVPSANDGKTCSKVCQCFADKENLRKNNNELSCTNIGCYQGLPCYVDGISKDHRSTFNVGDAICTCFDGEVICTKVYGNAMFPRANREIYCGCDADGYNPVCGYNGMTYASICHARCNGLEDAQLTLGSCLKKDACNPTPCPSFLVCMPHRRVCLLPNFPCPQYDCVEPDLTLDMIEPCLLDHDETRECEKEPLLKHCCKGNCHEKFNTSPVCGLDGVTYSSSCAAAGQLIPIDYEGPCIANVTPSIIKDRCKRVRCARKTLDCKWHVPVGGCCPICEPFLRVLYSRREARVHVEKVSPKPMIVRDVLEQMSQFIVVSECMCRGYLSMEGDIVVIVKSNLRRKSHLQKKICDREAERLASLINTRSPSITSNYYLSIAKAVFIQYPVNRPLSNGILIKSNLMLHILLPFIILLLLPK